MAAKLEGLGLSVLSRIARAGLPERVRRPINWVLYNGSKASFRAASTMARSFSGGPKLDAPQRLATPGHATDLFDLGLTEEQELIRGAVRRLAKDVIRPHAQEADATGKVPAAVSAGALEVGLVRYAVPEALGGVAVEQSTVTQMLIAEDLGWGDMGLGVAILSPIGVANALARWGTAAQQARYLPAFAADAPPVAAIAINEPSVVFDPNRLLTRASRDGAGYRLHGRKALVPVAEASELLLIAAQAEDGPAVFIVEGGAEGLSLEREGSMGLRAAAPMTIHLERVKAERLGDKTFDYTTFLDLGTLASSALATGCAQAVLEYVIPYCNERVAFGEPISNRQGVAFSIADIAIETDAMRMLTYRAGARAEADRPLHREAYLARLLCADKGMKIGSDGVQLLGGHGYTKEHPVERWYRDLRSTAVCYGLHL
jgi:alkylation response protein AidB-like acyl-CoA dehydrogenase